MTVCVKVPPEIEIVKEGREFLLDDGYFREHGRAGYRHLYLFNDAVLVCKPGETVIGKFFTKNDRVKRSYHVRYKAYLVHVGS